MKKRLTMLFGIAMILGLNLNIAQALFTTVTKVVINPVPFYTQVPGAMPQPLQTFAYTYTTANDGATLTVTDQIINSADQVVYLFGGTGTSFKSSGDYILQSWDGKANTGAGSGQYVPDGLYRLKVTSSDAASFIGTPFGVYKTEVPYLSLNNTSGDVYYVGGGTNFDINYTLKRNSVSTVNLKLKITGPSTNPQSRDISDSKSADGNYSISWDGKMNGSNAVAGSYTWALSGSGVVKDAIDYTVDGTTLTGNFTVTEYSAAKATISNLSVTPSPYIPANGNAVLEYSLNGSSGLATIEVALYDNNQNLIWHWIFNKQSGGSSISWNGTDSNNNIVGNGTYIFKVWGQDGNFPIASQQTNFIINSGVTPPVQNKCAGFTDVDANNSDCDAITYVKNIGAMTGNPNGTFDPTGILQRAQITKISLATFNLFNSSFNYCGGNNPFPDVSNSQWSYQYVCRGKDLGMITGYKSGVDAGYYRPSRSVNRVEFLALILRNVDDTMPGINSTSYADVSSGQWYSGFAKYSYDHSLFNGTRLYSTNQVSRVEVARIIYKLNLQGKI
jgi:flagellar hook assembly protein FlgD